MSVSASWTGDHWILRGVFTVDYWPNGIIYVHGTTGKPTRRVNSWEEAIAATYQLPPIVPPWARHKRKVLAEAQHIKDRLLRHSSICCYCGQTLREPTIEHKIPLIRGGTNDSVNLTLACRDCNQERGIG